MAEPIPRLLESPLGRPHKINSVTKMNKLMLELNFATPYEHRSSSPHQIRKDPEVESVDLMPCSATAMKMKIFINCMLLLVSIWACLHLLVAQYSGNAFPVWDVCGNNTYRNGSDFQHNLNKVLESLFGDAYTSGFNTRVEGKNKNSTVYGLVQCRGDLNSSDCKGSASTASKILLERCHKTSGLIQVESCFLRYDNHNFYNDYNESSKSSKFCNPNKAIVPEKFSNTTEEVLSKIIKKTVQSPGLFATDKSETDDPDLREIYSLAQCWNLSQTNCRSCLAAGRSIISGPGRSMASGARCKTGGLGGCYMSTNCILRYELYSFFNTSSIPSPPLPPPGESPPVSGIFFDMLFTMIRE